MKIQMKQFQLLKINHKPLIISEELASKEH